MGNNTEKKIDLWKEINSYINKIEESYSMFFSLVVTILGAVLTLLGTELLPKDVLFARIIALALIPVAMATVLAYLAYNFRMVAIARMYASKLEKEINNELSENIFAWNCDIVDKYLAKRNFTNTKLLPSLNLLFFTVTETFLNICMWDLAIHFLWKTLYTFVITVLFICCAAPFAKNDTIRKDNYNF